MSNDKLTSTEDGSSVNLGGITDTADVYTTKH